MEIADRIQGLQKSISSGRDELNKLEGSKEAHMKQLSENFGFQSLKSAKLGIAEMETTLKADKAKLANGLAKLEKRYEF